MATVATLSNPARAKFRTIYNLSPDQIITKVVTDPGVPYALVIPAQIEEIEKILAAMDAAIKANAQAIDNITPHVGDAQENDLLRYSGVEWRSSGTFKVQSVATGFKLHSNVATLEVTPAEEGQMMVLASQGTSAYTPIPVSNISGTGNVVAANPLSTTDDLLIFSDAVSAAAGFKNVRVLTSGTIWGLSTLNTVKAQAEAALGAIAVNVGTIGANGAAILANTASIDANVLQIDTNTAAIQTNIGSIATNTADIVTLSNGKQDTLAAGVTGNFLMYNGSAWVSSNPFKIQNAGSGFNLTDGTTTIDTLPVVNGTTTILADVGGLGVYKPVATTNIPVGATTVESTNTISGGAQVDGLVIFGDTGATTRSVKVDTASSPWTLTRLNALNVTVTANAAQIALNTPDISDNAAAILANTGDIEDNAAAILANTGNISTNAGDVAALATQVAANFVAIDGEISRATGVETGLQNQISANAVDIATNVTDIAALDTSKQDTLAAGADGNVLLYNGSDWAASGDLKFTNLTSGFGLTDGVTTINTLPVTAGVAAVLADTTGSGTYAPMTVSSIPDVGNVTAPAELSNDPSDQFVIFSDPTSPGVRDVKVLLAGAGVTTIWSQGTLDGMSVVVGANQQAIVTLTSNMGTIAGDVLQNAGDISDNSDAIAANGLLIQANTDAIAAIDGLPAGSGSNTLLQWNGAAWTPSELIAFGPNASTTGTGVAIGSAASVSNANAIAIGPGAYSNGQCILLSSMGTAQTVTTGINFKTLSETLVLNGQSVGTYILGATDGVNYSTKTLAELGIAPDANVVSAAAGLTDVAGNNPSLIFSNSTIGAKNVQTQLDWSLSTLTTMQTGISNNGLAIAAVGVDIAANTAAIDAEVLRATAAELGLQGGIDANTAAIGEEETRALAAEASLQSQISLKQDTLPAGATNNSLLQWSPATSTWDSTDLIEFGAAASGAANTIAIGNNSSAAGGGIVITTNNGTVADSSSILLDTAAVSLNVTANDGGIYFLGTIDGVDYVPKTATDMGLPQIGTGTEVNQLVQWNGYTWIKTNATVWGSNDTTGTTDSVAIGYGIVCGDNSVGIGKSCTVGDNAVVISSGAVETIGDGIIKISTPDTSLELIKQSAGTYVLASTDGAAFTAKAVHNVSGGPQVDLRWGYTVSDNTTVTIQGTDVSALQIATTPAINRYYATSDYTAYTTADPVITYNGPVREVRFTYTCTLGRLGAQSALLDITPVGTKITGSLAAMKQTMGIARYRQDYTGDTTTISVFGDFAWDDCTVSAGTFKIVLNNLTVAQTALGTGKFQLFNQALSIY